MATDKRRRDFRKLFDVSSHYIWANCAIHTNAEHRKVRNGIPKRFDNLPGNKRRAGFGKCTGNHHGYRVSRILEIASDREQASFEIERIDNRFREQDIDTPFDQRLGLEVIRSFHFFERNSTIGRIFDFS